jgi:hypothetical protein
MSTSQSPNSKAMANTKATIVSKEVVILSDYPPRALAYSGMRLSSRSKQRSGRSIRHG